MRFAFVYDDRDFPFVEPVRKVLQEVSAKLKMEGHQTLNFQFEQFWEIDLIAREIIFGSGAPADIMKGLEGEDPAYYNQAF